jgi:glutaredoxin
MGKKQCTTTVDSLNSNIKQAVKATQTQSFDRLIHRISTLVGPLLWPIMCMQYDPMAARLATQVCGFLHLIVLLVNVSGCEQQKPPPRRVVAASLPLVTEGRGLLFSYFDRHAQLRTVGRVSDVESQARAAVMVTVPARQLTKDRIFVADLRKKTAAGSFLCWIEPRSRWLERTMPKLSYLAKAPSRRRAAARVSNQLPPTRSRPTAAIGKAPTDTVKKDPITAKPQPKAVRTHLKQHKPVANNPSTHRRAVGKKMAKPKRRARTVRRGRKTSRQIRQVARRPAKTRPATPAPSASDQRAKAFEQAVASGQTTDFDRPSHFKSETGESPRPSSSARRSAAASPPSRKARPTAQPSGPPSRRAVAVAAKPRPPRSVAKKRVRPVLLFSTSWCPSCRAAKAFLLKMRVPFVELDVERDPRAAQRYQQIARAAGIRAGAVPLLLINGRVYQGFSRLQIHSALSQAGLIPN